MEENELKNSKEETAGETVPDLGKFKSVDALLRAYGELEAEFTRRSQKLKALEEASVQKAQRQARCGRMIYTAWSTKTRGCAHAF